MVQTKTSHLEKVSYAIILLADDMKHEWECVGFQVRDNSNTCITWKVDIKEDVE